MKSIGTRISQNLVRPAKSSLLAISSRPHSFTAESFHAFFQFFALLAILQTLGITPLQALPFFSQPRSGQETHPSQSDKPPMALPVVGAMQSAPIAASPSPSAVTPSYKLTANDIIHIRVFQEDELETSARITKSGTIPFPLLGSIVLGGRTVAEATTYLESALREYLIRPQVAIRIMEYAKRRFTILGQVNRPGTYDFPDDSSLTLLEAVGMAGGYTRIANPSKISVKRISQTGEQVFRLDGKKMVREKNTQPFFLIPGDTLVIEESLF